MMPITRLLYRTVSGNNNTVTLVIEKVNSFLILYNLYDALNIIMTL